MNVVAEGYFWHLCDAVPALDIPGTLNWDLSPRLTDRVSAGLLIAFKVLAIFPIARAARALLELSRREPTEPQMFRTNS
jgi:hypothetical protein